MLLGKQAEQMILEIQHETWLCYTEPVTESIAEVRMEPSSDDDQTCRSFHLAVNPPTGVFRFQDGFGNRVHHFNVLSPLSEMCIRAAALVETHPRARDLLGSQAVYPLSSEQSSLELFDFLPLRGPVRRTPALLALLDKLRPQQGARLGEFVVEVSRYIHTHFEYAPRTTLANSPIDDVLTLGKGVCQDFTHLMIAVLRSFAVPARYVSGYLHHPEKEAQSHAWCEVFLPDLGWVAVDPTNDQVADERFVKVAIGRDFTDVPPNKGIYRGKAQEQIKVRVSTRILDTLPSLAWQEQLPPLQTPLTAIVNVRHAPDLYLHQDSDQQQQQQQQ
jgi:transglutaminase-like putative cysteine protease